MPTNNPTPGPVCEGCKELYGINIRSQERLEELLARVRELEEELKKRTDSYVEYTRTAEAKLRRIVAAAGMPDAADACRAIIKIATLDGEG
jgi:predicted PP-loop superfamily ATPase